MKFARQALSTIAAASLCLGFMSSASAQHYLVQDLGNVVGTSLNALGQVAGYQYTDSSVQAFYTGANGIGQNFLALGGASAYGINDLGQVVGQYTTSTGDLHGFVTGASGQGITDVTLSSSSAINLLAINANGQYGGWVAEGETQNAISTGPNGTGLQTLSLPGTTLGSTVTGINASGQVLGYAFTGDSAFTYITGPNGQGATQIGPNGAAGLGLNNQGDVVGQTFTEAGDPRGFLTRANGSTTILGTLGGFASRATGINDSGVIVGMSLTADAPDGSSTNAFVILGDGQDMVSLASLAVDFEGTFAEAVAVNNAGQILVNSFGRSYLLTPTAIPEAQTSAMMLLGLGAIGWVGVRQQRRRQFHA